MAYKCLVCMEEINSGEKVEVYVVGYSDYTDTEEAAAYHPDCFASLTGNQILKDYRGLSGRD